MNASLKEKIGATLLLAGMAFSIWGCGEKKETTPLKESMRPISMRQVVATNNEKERTVMWQLTTDKDNTLEYRKAGDDKVQSVNATKEAFKGNKGTPDTTIYTAQMKNLEKGNTYEYRTRSGNSVSPWYTMKTDSGSFKALVTSDSQSSDYTDWEKLVNDAYQRNQDADFFIDLGDIVDNGEDEYQWQAWFKTVSRIVDKIPVVPALGNHEAYSLDWKETMPKRYLSHFQLPSNGDREMKNHYYSYDWGDVHFVVLDTSRREQKEWIPDLYEKEKVWLDNDLKKTNKKWKVVLMHKDPLQYGFEPANRPHREEGFSEEGKEFMPIFDKNGVDLVLSAHLHTYRDRGHIYDFQRSEKGPVYIILGLGGNVRYPGLWKKHSLDEYIAPQPETDNYNILEQKGNELKITGYLPDGTMLHERVLRKD